MSMAKPCAEPACASKSKAMQQMFARADRKAQDKVSQQPCPPDRDELGRHSWTLVRAPACGTHSPSMGFVPLIRALRDSRRRTASHNGRLLSVRADVESVRRRSRLHHCNWFTVPMCSLPRGFSCGPR